MEAKVGGLDWGQRLNPGAQWEPGIRLSKVRDQSEVGLPFKVAF